MSSVPSRVPESTYRNVIGVEWHSVEISTHDLRQECPPTNQLIPIPSVVQLASLDTSLFKRMRYLSR